METQNKISIISIIIAILALFLTVVQFIISYSIKQKVSIVRTDDVFIANEFGDFPVVQTQYSFTANGPSTKTTTITRVKLTITRESDNKQLEIYPQMNTVFQTTLPINLVGNSSTALTLIFKPKQNVQNISNIDTWSKDIASNLSGNNLLIFEKALNIFNSDFTLDNPNNVQNIFKTIQQDQLVQKLSVSEYDELLKSIDIKKLLFFYENTYHSKVEFYNSKGDILYTDSFAFNIDNNMQKRLENKLNYFVLIEPKKI